MARQQVSNINPVAVDKAANRVQTFVQGPRAPRSNSLVEFAGDISKFADNMSVQIQRDNLEQQREAQAVAADNKIYGSNLATRAAIDINHRWEQEKSKYHSLEEADQWWSQQSIPEEYKTLLGSNVHIQSGYQDRINDMKLRSLSGFSSDLIERQKTSQKENFRDWFTTEVTARGTSAAFAGQKDYAKVQGISPKELNGAVLESVEILAQNKQYGLAEEVLKHERNPQARSLVFNDKDPDAHRRANDLLASVQSASQKERYFKIREDKEYYDQKIKDGNFDDRDLHDIGQKIGSIKGYMTKSEYGKYVDAAVRKQRNDTLYAQLDDNFNAGNFYKPITGNTQEDETIRKGFVSRQVNAINSDASLNDDAKFFRKMSLSASTNMPIDDVKNSLEVGYSTIIPAYVVSKGEVPAATLKGVETYMYMQQNFPNQVNAHVDKKSQDFYEDVSASIKYMNMQPVDAVRSVVASSQTQEGMAARAPSLSAEDVSTKLASFKVGDGDWNPLNDPVASVATQRYAPVVRNLATRYMRNGLSKGQALNAAMDRIKQNVVVINGYPVDRGVHTDIPPHIDMVSKNTVSKFIKDNNLATQYDDKDLLLTPDPKRGGHWWITERGTGAMLETLTTDKLISK